MTGWLTRLWSDAGVPRWLYCEGLSPQRCAIENEWRKAVRGDSGAGIARTAQAMAALRAQRPRRPLLAPANERALRWVDRQVRACRAARMLKTVQPELPLRVRLWLAVARLTVPVAALVVLMLCRSGVLLFLSEAYRAGSSVAGLHVDRHIGPMA